MSKYAKYLSPLAFSLSCLLCYGILAAIFSRIRNLGGAILGIIFGATMILTLFLIAVPCHCFVYGRKILRCEKRKFIFSLYNALVLTLSYLLPFCMEGETYLYSALLFMWALLWSALPLLFRKREKSNK